MEALLAKVSEEVKCPICHDLMIKPMMTSVCGHSFCYTCWDTFRGLTKASACPMCRAALTTPAILNKTLWKVIQHLFPDKARAAPRDREDFASFITKIYVGMAQHRRFPSGYRRFMDTKLTTCTPNDIVLCNCGLIAMDRTVRKEGINHGRLFSSCPFAQHGCGHFQWLHTNRNQSN